MDVNTGVVTLIANFMIQDHFIISSEELCM